MKKIIILNIKIINISILIIIILIDNLFISKRKYSNCYFIIEKNNFNIYDKFNCFKKKIININYLKEIENHRQKIDFLILNSKNTRIENILILIGILPFMKKNSLIILTIESKIAYKIIHNLFKKKKKKNIILDRKDLIFLYNNFYGLISYKWELIPSFCFLNNIRYIINNYYNEKFLDIYDKIINDNLDYYISKNKYYFKYENIKKLMSKFFNFI